MANLEKFIEYLLEDMERSGKQMQRIQNKTKQRVRGKSYNKSMQIINDHRSLMRMVRKIRNHGCHGKKINWKKIHRKCIQLKLKGVLSENAVYECKLLADYQQYRKEVFK